MEDKIMAVTIGKRTEKAPNVQQVLTNHGCIIKTRLGLHDDVGDTCKNNGLLLLHLNGDKENIDKLYGDLHQIDGVGVNMMDIL